jgi:clan AA aspartic protease
MGVFRESIQLAHPNRRAHPIAVEALVDTGATYSWIPEELLKRLRIKPIEVRPLKIANGSIIKRKLGLALVTVRGKTMPTPVLFGDKGSESLLGAVTLEELGLSVDPIHRTLVPATAYLLSLW